MPEFAGGYLLAMPRVHRHAQDCLAPTTISYGPFHTRPSREDKGETKAIELASSSKPVVMVLALENDRTFHNQYVTFYDSLRAKAKLVKANLAKDALVYLASSELSAVFIPDVGITKWKNARVLAKLVEFAKSGGSVVVRATFSSFVDPMVLNTFFLRWWGLRWEGGSSHRTTFSLNKSHFLAKSRPSLLQSYSMRALHVKNITPEVALYSPTEDSHLESLMSAPTKITDLSESPIAHTQIGKGYFGYVGDVNREKGSDMVILAMLGLLDPLPSPSAETVGLSQGKEVGPSGMKTPPTPAWGKTISKPGTSSGAKTAMKTQMKAALKPQSTSNEPTISSRTDPPPVSKPNPKPLNPFILILSLENEDSFESIHNHLLSVMRKKKWNGNRHLRPWLQ